VHYPAVGFFHDKHNVCMRRLKADSHFGQMRLPLDLPGDDADADQSPAHDAGRAPPPPSGGVGPKRVWYHDIYSRQFFLTSSELHAEADALSCGSILDQHVCPDTLKPDNYRASRYCYRRGSEAADEAAKKAQSEAAALGAAALQRARKGLPARPASPRSSDWGSGVPH